jgi:fatty-acyl-CoA synthase
MGKGLLSGLTRRLTEEPDAVALVYYATARNHVELSWRELAGRAAAAAEWLRAHSDIGAMTFILDHDPLRQMQWWLASLLADTVPGILTPPTPKLDLERYRTDIDQVLRKHAGALVLYGDRIFQIAPAEPRFLNIANVMYPDAPPVLLPRASTLAALFQQSSGTTGLRKGIVLDEIAVVNQLQAYSEALQLNDQDCILSWLPLYHDMGLIACLSLAMYAGLRLVLTSPFVWLGSPGWWISAAHEHRTTLSWLPNFAFNVMVDRVDPQRFPKDALTSLRDVIDCSEPVLPSSLRAFSERFEEIGLRPTVVSSCYAMAENTFAVTQTPPGTPVAVETVDASILEHDARAVPAREGRSFAGSGRLISGTALRIVTDDRECAEREVGEIVITSNCLMRGYEGIGSDTPCFDRNGWFLTGDLGYVVDGELFVIGRKTDIIIRAGRNLDPTVFEAAVSSVPGVKRGRVVAIGVPNERDGTDDIVIIAERTDDGISEDEIRSGIIAACETQTGSIPQKVSFVAAGWLAKSSSGKLSRAACKAKYANLVATVATK